MFRALCRSSSGTSTVFEPLVYIRLRRPPLVLSECLITFLELVVISTKFHPPSYSASLIIPVVLRPKDVFSTTGMLFFCL
jgi:hypothetical protein